MQKRPARRARRKKTVVAVSGGFDPVHIGHVRLFEAARKLGDELVVILNNDNWLLKKKGYVFMPQKDRKEILEAILHVDRVVISSHSKDPEDMSVAEDLAKVRPHVFANGGDRTAQDSHRKASSLNPDREMCVRLGVEMRFNVGRGGKIRSSSEIVKKRAR